MERPKYPDCEKVQWLESDHDRKDPETDIHMWGCLEHKEWTKEYVFNSDGTVSPKQNPQNVCLGVQKGNTGKIVFVPRNDTTRRLVLGGGDDLASYFEQMRADAAKAESDLEAAKHTALSKLTSAFCTAFRNDGFCKLGGLVPLDIVLTARGEINRQLGDGTGDALKAKTFASHPAILSLVRDSAVPAMLVELLGGHEDWYRQRLDSGQLALRFPGDLCPPYSKLGPQGSISAAHFEGIRKGWHIDGCPSDFLPGVTDHFGTIHNFNVLIGVLLSDTFDKGKMAGELVCYPGSHLALSKYFERNRDVLEKLRVEGGEHLPRAQTDALFDRPVVHCTGKAGDVFLINYMTAHLIAPNTSADIRYAVYFRVSGPAFEETKAPTGGNVGAMLEPWGTWAGLLQKCGGAGVAARAIAAPLPPPPAERLPISAREMDMQRHLASADYVYLQRQHTSRISVDVVNAGGDASHGLEALTLMFPHIDLAALLDVLRECQGNADQAAEHLLQLFPPPSE